MSIGIKAARKICIIVDSSSVKNFRRSDTRKNISKKIYEQFNVVLCESDNGFDEYTEILQIVAVQFRITFEKTNMIKI